MKTKADRFGVVYSADGKQLLYCRNKKLRVYTIKEGTEEIAEYAFEDCEILEHIILPESLLTIGDSAFFDCFSLKSIMLPKSMESIGKCAFGRCFVLEEINIDSANPYFTSVDNVLFSRDMTRIVQYAPGKPDSHYVIPNSITEIASYAFYSCCELKSVVVPDGVTKIDDMTFHYCKQLESITIPTSVRAIGKCVFANCDNLKSIFIPKSVEKIGLGTFDYCWKLKIRCEAESKPEGWDKSWIMPQWPVVWGVKS